MWRRLAIWLRHKRFSEQSRFRPDESARQFAEQWDKHPTLSHKQLSAIRRTYRKKNP